MTLSRQCVGLFVGLIARGCWGVRPSCDTIRHRVKKQSIKTCLSAQQVLFSIFPPLLDPASKPLLHCIPGTNVCGFFLVSAFTGIASWGVCTFSLRHFVPSDTAAPTPPRAVGISQSFASGNGSATSCNEPNASHSPTIKCQPRGR